MNLYQKFRKLSIDFDAIGLGRRDDDVTYFCTPKGAKIIGWAGVDGIHYCTVRGFGEMVFAVSPMNLPGDYVHPIARNFGDLLRLLLACGTMDALEQAHQWDREQFAAYVAENRPTEAQKAVLDILAETFSLNAMEDPYGYLQALRQSFDYSQIPYSPEYYDPDMNPAAEEPEQPWKVTYDGGFWRHTGRAGREISLGKHFSWGEASWYVPAAYVCGKGLVLDLCRETDPQKMKDFINKWDLLHEGDHHYTEDEQMQIRSENPMDVDFRCTVILNGKTLRQDHGCGVSWIAPECLGGEMDNSREGKALVEHYGLDPSRCWSFHRLSFPWATKRPPALRSLWITLEQDPQDLPGPRFPTPAVGESVTVVHPITGREHVLTVREYEAQEMDQNCFGNEEMEYPTHYTAMTYTLEPDIPDDGFRLQDCDQGDPPRARAVVPDGPTAVCSAVVMGVIGRADGPTAIVLSGGPARLHAACSALHFAPVTTVTWYAIFREKLLSDCTVALL